MRKLHHIHPDDLMRPDFVSEIVLASCLLAFVVAVLFTLLKALP